MNKFALFSVPENCGSPPLNEAKQALQQAINEATDREKEGSVGGEDNSNNGNAKENPCHEDNNISLPERWLSYFYIFYIINKSIQFNNSFYELPS